MEYYMSSTHESLKRRWEGRSSTTTTTSFYPRYSSPTTVNTTSTTTTTTETAQGKQLHHPVSAAAAAARTPRKILRFSALDEEMACAVMPPVTVVLEGRSICHRIHLHRHDSYESLAAALRRMFVDIEGTSPSGGDDGRLDLSNAVPGYLVAYEDMEDDLLLAGDLSWKDFVRVVKRIRILPAKPKRGRRISGGGGGGSRRG